MQLKSPMNLILSLKKAHYCALMHASLPNSRTAVPRKMPSRERTCLEQNNENVQPDIYLRSCVICNMVGGNTSDTLTDPSDDPALSHSY